MSLILNALPYHSREYRLRDPLTDAERQVVEGFLTGKHRSSYHGFSVEYLDHRSYTLGDNMRTLTRSVQLKRLDVIRRAELTGPHRIRHCVNV